MKKTEKKRPAVGLAVPVGSTGLELRTLNDLREFAKVCHDGGAVPVGMNVEAAAVAIQAGLERGLGPIGGLSACLVVNGGITWRGQAAAALIRTSSVCRPGTYVQGYTGGGDALVGYATAHRIDYAEPVRVEFSVADAKRARLWGNPGPWTEYPARQLMWRAVGFLARDHFSDVTGGFPIAEEAMDFRAEAPRGRSMVVAPAAPVAVEATPDPILAMLEEAPEVPAAPLTEAPRAQVVDLMDTLKASLAQRGVSPADEPGAAEAAVVFVDRVEVVREAEPDLEPVEEPAAPEEIPPPAVVAGSISELKAKLEAQIAPIVARTKPGCDHPKCTPERVADATARGKSLVCMDCGEEISAAPPPPELELSAAPIPAKARTRTTRLL